MIGATSVLRVSPEISETDLGRRRRERAWTAWKIPDVGRGYGIVHRGRLEQGVALLQKPITEEELANKIHALLVAKPGAGTLLV
jgi:hypothetical protein